MRLAPRALRTFWADDAPPLRRTSAGSAMKLCASTAASAG
jgi:hypothetical protein